MSLRSAYHASSEVTWASTGRALYILPTHNKKSACFHKRTIGIRRRPTLPDRYQSSTIGTEGLNFCVRYGNRWNPFVIATGNGELYQKPPFILYHWTSLAAISPVPLAERLAPSIVLIFLFRGPRIASRNPDNCTASDSGFYRPKFSCFLFPIGLKIISEIKPSTY